MKTTLSILLICFCFVLGLANIAAVFTPKGHWYNLIAGLVVLGLGIYDIVSMSRER